MIFFTESFDPFWDVLETNDEYNRNWHQMMQFICSSCHFNIFIRNHAIKYVWTNLNDDKNVQIPIHSVFKCIFLYLNTEWMGIGTFLLSFKFVQKYLCGMFNKDGKWMQIDRDYHKKIGYLSIEYGRCWEFDRSQSFFDIFGQHFCHGNVAWTN